MLLTEAPFPHPGSYADHFGQRGRILQHMPDGIALLSVAGHHRRAPLSELTDPADDNVREQALIGGLSNADTARALWIARHLRDSNETTLADLAHAMDEAADQDQVCRCYDRGHISRILRKLGWVATRRPLNGRAAYVYVRAGMERAA